jgi:hypothetical protein
VILHIRPKTRIAPVKPGLGTLPFSARERKPVFVQSARVWLSRKSTLLPGSATIPNPRKHANVSLISLPRLRELVETVDRLFPSTSLIQIDSFHV